MKEGEVHFIHLPPHDILSWGFITVTLWSQPHSCYSCPLSISLLSPSLFHCLFFCFFFFFSHTHTQPMHPPSTITSKGCCAAAVIGSCVLAAVPEEILKAKEPVVFLSKLPQSVCQSARSTESVPEREFSEERDIQLQLCIDQYTKL